MVTYGSTWVIRLSDGASGSVTRLSFEGLLHQQYVTLSVNSLLRPASWLGPLLVGSQKREFCEGVLSVHPSRPQWLEGPLMSGVTIATRQLEAVWPDSKEYLHLVGGLCVIRA